MGWVVIISIDSYADFVSTVTAAFASVLAISKEQEKITARNTHTHTHTHSHQRVALAFSRAKGIRKEGGGREAGSAARLRNRPLVK
jgi:hypothetical protein